MKVTIDATWRWRGEIEVNDPDLESFHRRLANAHIADVIEAIEDHREDAKLDPDWEVE